MGDTARGAARFPQKLPADELFVVHIVEPVISIERTMKEEQNEP
jgi:hypothetical protein